MEPTLDPTQSATPTNMDYNPFGSSMSFGTYSPSATQNVANAVANTGTPPSASPYQFTPQQDSQYQAYLQSQSAGMDPNSELFSSQYSAPEDEYDYLGIGNSIPVGSWSPQPPTGTAGAPPSAQPNDVILPLGGNPPPPAAPPPPGSPPAGAPASGIDPSKDVLNGSIDFSQFGALGDIYNNLGGSPQQALAALGPDYQAAYNAYLNAAGSMYNNTIAGYQQLMANQQRNEAGVTAGYNTLGQNVQNLLQGADQSQMQQVQNQYAQNAANINAQLANSGLGNTTVGGSMLTGNQQSESQAETNVANTFANTQAGYMSNIGQAGLQYQGQAINADTGLGQAQLNYMANINIPPPDASAYGSIATQAGAAIQSNADRAQQAQEFAQLLAASQSAGNLGAGGGGFQGSLGAPFAAGTTPGLFDGGPGMMNVPGGMGGVPGIPGLTGNSASRPLGGIANAGSPSGGGIPGGLPLPGLGGTLAPGGGPLGAPGAALVGGAGAIAAGFSAPGGSKAAGPSGQPGETVSENKGGGSFTNSEKDLQTNQGWYLDENGQWQSEPYWDPETGELTEPDESGPPSESKGLGNPSVSPGGDTGGEDDEAAIEAELSKELGSSTWNSLTPAQQQSYEAGQKAIDASKSSDNTSGIFENTPPSPPPPPPAAPDQYADPGNQFGDVFHDTNAANVHYETSGPMAGMLYDQSTQTFYNGQGHAVGTLDSVYGAGMTEANALQHGGNYVDPTTGESAYSANENPQVIAQNQANVQAIQEQQAAYEQSIADQYGGGEGGGGGEQFPSSGGETEPPPEEQTVYYDPESGQTMNDQQYQEQVAQEQQAEEEAAAEQQAEEEAAAEQQAEEEALASEYSYDESYGAYGGGGEEE